MTEQNRIEVLDHGYVELIEPWGSDERIIKAKPPHTWELFMKGAEK